MKRLLIISAILLTAASQALSQNSVDALRYSRIDIGGTARFMGMSGAFGALGADFTNTSINPAGIGMYKSSEFIFTPAVHIGSVESLYNGTVSNDQRSNFYVGNAGMVLASKSKTDPTKKGWRGFTFASGVNRLADFNYRYNITGGNSENSLLDTYVEYADGVPFSDLENDPDGYYAFDLNLAWWTYLLDFENPDIDGKYVSPIPVGEYKLQNKYIDSWGSMNEYVFSFGANYSDRLYLGMTFGIPMIRYYENSVYEESSIQNSELVYFQKIDELETHGSGFNFKLGFIYRASEWLRVGGSFHTPSWFNNMKDYWQTTMIAEFATPDINGNYKYVETSPAGNYNYSLQTPLRVQGSLGFIVGNAGVISADYEFADYGSSNFDAPDYPFADENQAISNSYASGHHIRLGTEWRYDIFSFRAGGKYFTSPYQNDLNDGSKYGFSGGIGLKEGWFFMDFAYAYTKMEEDYYLYSSATVVPNPAVNSLRNHSIVLTLGAKL